MSARLVRRALLAATAVVASIGAMVAVPLDVTQASAQPSTDVWSVSGPSSGTTNLLSDGANGDPSFSYYDCNPADPFAGCGEDESLGFTSGATWTFQATALQAETVSWTYVWTGSHSCFDATATLQAFTSINGATTLVSASNIGCSFSYQNTYMFSDLSQGETYGFYVSGSNYDEYPFLEGTFTLEPPPPPAAPTGLVATAVGNGAVNLTWSAPPGGTSPTSYEVFAGTGPGDETATPISTVTAPATSTTVTTLAGGTPFTDGTPYYFTVEALNGSTASGASNEVSATPSVLQPNTSWFNAQPVVLTPNASGGGGTGSTSESIDQTGESLWYEVPVQPDQQVQVSLANVPADYDIAVFSDISQAFSSETSSTPNLLALGAENPGDAASASAFSASAFSASAFSASAFSASAFSPSAFSPSAFSASAFSASAFSASAFSASAFSASAFSASAFSASAFSASAFSASAFSAAYADAQIDSLLAVSTAPGAVSKSVTVDTWNNTGHFYVRISGNNGAFAPSQPFSLAVTTTGSACSALTTPINTATLYNTSTTGGTISGAGGPARQTVIVEDSALMTADYPSDPDLSSLSGSLSSLAAATDGVVVDVSLSPQIDALISQAQAPANAGCPYAENLVAQAIQDVINTYRVTTTNLKYVVIVGDDDVIPFFRYPDNAGLAPESDYEPPLLSTTPAGAALQGNYYLSDDQYGASSELTVQGTTVPLPSAAVGRLVETPSDIVTTIKNDVNSTDTGLNTIAPKSSLVTGYDFMQPPATQVASAFATGVAPGPNSTLITNDGVAPSSTCDSQSLAPGPTCSWSAADLTTSLFGSHHDLVFLGAHFSANNLLAADDTTTLTTNQFASQVGTTLSGSLVLSAGCHSGYNIDGLDAVPGVTDPLAWPQAFTEAGATLIAGTGYQYGDTNYVAYSDEIYVLLAQQLGYEPGTSPGPVPIGSALLGAKLQYLAGLDELNGVEEKALSQITLYGLPMLGIQETNEVPAPGGNSSSVFTSPPSGVQVVQAPTTPTSNPGSALQLEVASINVAPTLTTKHAPAPNSSYTYDAGPAGQVADPGGPVLPLQFEDVNQAGETLRGVGFWSGTYADSTATPLTGDPATDTGNPNIVPFTSPVFFPQSLWNPNYFPTLFNGGDTELALTPVQYDGNGTADDMRTYSNLGLNLFYSDNTSTYTDLEGNNYVPALAAPPTISDVTSSVNGDQVAVSAQVSGDPSAGIQEVWATYTDTSPGPLYGTWQSVALQQPGGSGTLWSGTITDAAGGQTGDPAADMQFIVQAANGVGEVSMDNNDGYYFTPSVNPGSQPAPGTSTTSFNLSISAPGSGPYQGSVSVSATLAPTTGNLSAAVPGEDITFDLGTSTVSAPIVANSGDTSGTATATVPLTQTPGSYTLSATYGGDPQDQPAAQSTSLTINKTSTSLQLLTAPSKIVAGQDNGVTAQLKATVGSPGVSVALPQEPVYFVLSNSGGPVLTTVGITNTNGVASAGVLNVPAADTGTSVTNDTITAYFASNIPLAGGTSYNATDPAYAPSTSSMSPVNSVTAPPSIVISAPSSVPTTGTYTPVTYTATVHNYDGSTGTPSCTPASGAGFPLGSTTISCSTTDKYGNTATATAAVDVTPAPLTLTISGTQTYGSPPMFAYSAAGLVGKDTTTVITGTLTCSTTPATSSSSPVGTYAIASCSGLTVPSYYTAIASDYKLGSLIIGTAPLTVTASSATVSYGQAPPQITASYNGFVPGDSSSSLTARPTCSTTATQTSPPGTYPTTCTGAVDVNYSPINYVKGTVTVTPSTMLVLGPGTGTLTMSGQATANVRGNLAVSSPSTGSINLSGQASLKAAGTLISPAAKPVVSSGQATTSVGSQETLPAEPDPYAGLAAPSTTGMTVYSSSTLQGPGVYTKAVTVSGQTKVTLASGTYVFDNGLTLSGQASVTSASGGVLLFFAGGELSISGQAAAVLLPLASGPYQAISLFQARTDTQAIILSGQDHTTSMVGALYAPVATLELSGQAVLAVGGLITDGVTLTGQAGVTVG